MSRLFDECSNYFGTDNLYNVLNVERGASENEVKRAYHRISLKVHPDRVAPDEKEDATKKFQTLGKVYAVLSNSELRKVYDETGEVDEESSSFNEDRDWYQYWRLLFAKISVNDIKEFEKNYKGSSEELEDLKTAYIDSEGDMDTILETVMCASLDDEDRFRSLIEEWIKKKEVKCYKAFAKEDKKKKKMRIQKATAEAAEAEEMKKELGLGDSQDSLKQMILQKRQTREDQADSFFAQLEAKYAQPKSKKNKKK